MRLDVILPSTSLTEIPGLASAAERIGFHGLWSSETQHDPFLPLALAAEHTRSVTLGTALAVAFARSPGALAYAAWDLAQASHGRFILGLGSQVRAHVERRFGLPYPDSPVGRMRETILGIRSLWRAWQTGEPLSFRGDDLKLTLMTPFFNPGPIEHPEIPIFLAAVNPGMCHLAGEVADGLLVHPYHSRRYVEEVVRPAVAAGAARAGRDLDDVRFFVTAFAVPEPGMEVEVRTQIAFYASTPQYRPVMALHGWGDTAEALSAHARRRAWADMGPLVSNDMLEAFAVVAAWDELAGALHRRYRGLADRLALYLPFAPGERDVRWQRLVADWEAAG
jgi:probable F420-dependent oxidoreductase